MQANQAQMYKTPQGYDQLKAEVEAIRLDIRRLRNEISDADLSVKEETCDPAYSNLMVDETTLKGRLRDKEDELARSKACHIPAERLRERALLGSVVICEECDIDDEGNLVPVREQRVQIMGWRESYTGDGVQGVSYTTPLGQSLFKKSQGEEVEYTDNQGQTSLFRIKNLFASVEEAMPFTQPSIA